MMINNGSAVVEVDLKAILIHFRLSFTGLSSDPSHGSYSCNFSTHLLISLLQIIPYEEDHVS